MQKKDDVTEISARGDHSDHVVEETENGRDRRDTSGACICGFIAGELRQIKNSTLLVVRLDRSKTDRVV